MVFCAVLIAMLYKDVILLQRVQKRLARMLPKLEGLNYKEQLDRLGLFSMD